MARNTLERSLLNLLKFILPFHAAAWCAVSEPITRFLEEPGDDERDRLTVRWKETNLSQLQAICVSSALIGGVVSASYTWPVLGNLAASNRSTVMAIWYSALVMALTSVATSAQQAVALNRLATHPEGLQRIRDLLGKQTAPGVWRPRKLQLIIWQTPISLLNSSIVLYAVGLSVLVWTSVSWAWTWNDSKVVILYTVVLAYAAVLYVITAFGIYQRPSRSPASASSDTLVQRQTTESEGSAAESSKRGLEEKFAATS
ncbi:hypothetical protein GGR53DRAFT_498623 [Hypoxylon sp. FL1150]|nr:hypothetical protein GGR53DRAFT_498623 [Hypoxylon sp. FL1150]